MVLTRVTMLKIMDTEEFRTAQSCYLFLDEFLQHPVLKDVNDITKCVVCGMKFFFHRRSGSSNCSSVMGNVSSEDQMKSISSSMSPVNQIMGVAGAYRQDPSPVVSSSMSPVNQKMGVAGAYRQDPSPVVSFIYCSE